MVPPLCTLITDDAGGVVTPRTPVTMTRSELKPTVVLVCPPLLLPPPLPLPDAPASLLAPEPPLLPDAPLLLLLEPAGPPLLLPFPLDEPPPELLPEATPLPLPLPPWSPLPLAPEEDEDEDAAAEPLLLLLPEPPVSIGPLVGVVPLPPQFHIPAPARPASKAPRPARAHPMYILISLSVDILSSGCRSPSCLRAGGEPPTRRSRAHDLVTQWWKPSALLQRDRRFGWPPVGGNGCHR